MKRPTKAQHLSLAKRAAEIATRHGVVIHNEGRGWRSESHPRRFHPTTYRVDTAIGAVDFELLMHCDAPGAWLQMRFQGDPETVRAAIHWPELNPYTFHKCNVYAGTALDACRILDTRLACLLDMKP